MKKVLSIILFILAILFAGGAIGNTLLRSSAGLGAECGLVLFMLALAGLLVWGGIALWRKG